MRTTQNLPSCRADYDETEVTDLVVDTSSIDREIAELEAKVRRLSRMKRKMELEAMKGLYSSKQAAEYLGVSKFTPRNWRQKGCGPAYIVAPVPGHPGAKACYYRLEDLDAFAASRNERDVA